MAKDRAEFLKSCALSIAPDSQHWRKLLKSHYMLTSLSVAHQLPVVSQMCPKCCSIWSESEYKLKLSKSANHHKELNKLIALQAQGSISRKKRLRMKWLRKQGARLKIECTFCQTNSSIAIEKTKKKHTVKQTADLQVENTTNISIPVKKRKHKRKDKTAGLKIPAATAQKNTSKKPVSSTVNGRVNAQLKSQHDKLKNSFQNAIARQTTSTSSSALQSLLK